MYICIYIHTYIYISKSKYFCVCIYIYLHTCIYMYLNVHMLTHIYKYILCSKPFDSHSRLHTAGEAEKAAIMWGYVTAALILAAVSVVSWKVCLTPQPCKTRCAVRRRPPSDSAPREPPSDEKREAQGFAAVRYAPRVAAGASTLLSRRHGVNATDTAPPAPQARFEMRVMIDEGAATGQVSSSGHRRRNIPQGSEVQPRSPGHVAGKQYAKSPRSPLPSPRRQGSGSQAVAYRQPLAGLELSEPIITAARVQHSLASRREHTLSDSPAVKAHQGAWAGSSSTQPLMNSGWLHSPQGTPSHTHRGGLEWSTPVPHDDSDAAIGERVVRQKSCIKYVACGSCNAMLQSYTVLL